MHKVVINSCYGCFWLSNIAHEWLREHYNISDFEKLSRHDPRLIECVETLGDYANGFLSKLTVVEIEDNMYRIEDYDGYEHLVTPSMEKYIVID